MKKILLLVALVAVVLVSGCTGPDSGTNLPYSNDVVTVEDFYVSDTNPYEGSVVIVDFLIQNNGETDGYGDTNVPRVKVGFDAPGFNIKETYCEGTEESVRINDNEGYCVFSEDSSMGPIESLDTRRVILTLEVQEVGILKPKIYTLNYYVEYDYSGFRKMDIPIIDGTTRKKPLAQYSQSSETYGPIKLSFELPESGESMEGNQVVKQYWGIRDSPFKVVMKFTHVGSSSLGVIKEPVIKTYSVKADLRDSLKVASFGDNELYCDFDTYDGWLASSKDVNVPGELVCNLQSTQFQDPSFSEPETRATMWVYYDYTYRYTNSKDFNIQPLPQTDTTSSHVTQPDDGDDILSGP